MTEPLNITLDRLSEEYAACRMQCESAKQPHEKETASLLAIIEGFRMIGITVDTPDYCRPKIANAVQRLEGIYRVHNVPYRGENHTADITRELLDGGVSRTQDEWLQKYPLGIVGQIGIPDTEIYFAIIRTLDKNKKHADVQQRGIINEIRNAIEVDFRKYWMMTSTRTYPDKIVHQCQTPQAITRHSIKGKSGYLAVLSDGDAIAEILGNTTAARLNDTIASITGKETFVCREADDKHALVLGVNVNDRFYINANNGVYDVRPARGMAVRKMVPQ